MLRMVVWLEEFFSLPLRRIISSCCVDGKMFFLLLFEDTSDTVGIVCFKVLRSGFDDYFRLKGDDTFGFGSKTDTEGREDVHEVFQQRGSGVKRKLSRCGRNQLGNEPILALPEGADDFAVYYDARSKDLEACLEKGRSEFDFEAKYHLGKANVDVVPWSRKKE
ncbi:hypothetical protein Tco_0446024 [Tanacetum coccineum]